ncbi:MAG: PhoH family protein, partial [Wolinella sp.]
RKNFSELSDWSIIEVNEEDNTESSLYLTGKKRFGLKFEGRFEEQRLDEILEDTNPYIKPINLEQKLYYSMLIHPKNKITVATGSTGSGKTLIALQAGIHLVKKGVVDGIVYLRNTVTANDKEAELGFRKGDEGQKLGYFMYPLYSAVNFTIEKMQKESLAKKIEYRGDVNSIEKQEATEYFLQKHNIEVIDIAHARGVTIARKFVIFDEAQNASNATIKLIGTRMGEESRIVFLGDWAQIDHPYLSKFRNGIVSMLQKAKQDNFIAGIQLKQTIRSEIAGWFQQNF